MTDSSKWLNFKVSCLKSRRQCVQKVESVEQHPTVANGLTISSGDWWPAHGSPPTVCQRIGTQVLCGGGLDSWFRYGNGSGIVVEKAGNLSRFTGLSWHKKCNAPSSRAVVQHSFR